VGQGLLFHDVSRSHTTTHQSVGLLWTSDQLVAETSTWQHTTLTADRHPCPPVGLEPTTSAGGRPKTYALYRVATICHTKPHFAALLQAIPTLDSNRPEERGSVILRWRHDPKWNGEGYGFDRRIISRKDRWNWLPAGQLGATMGVAIQTFYLKHETCNLLGRGLGGGGGKTAKCRYFRRKDINHFPNTPTPTATHQSLSLVLLIQPPWKTS
jgi:hypothetical protein